MSVSVEGHAGYGEKGKDIVCAAVSALCIALDAALTKFCDNGKMFDICRDIGDGTVNIQVKNFMSYEIYTRVKDMFYMFFIGMEEIEKQYPLYVQTRRIY